MTDDSRTALSLEKLQPGTSVSGTVTCLVLSGAMVDIGLEEDALLHVSQLKEEKNNRIRNVDEVLSEGDTLDAFVLKVDPRTDHVALTMVKPPALPWEVIRKGETYRGKVTRIEKFGAFIDIGAERPGMVHVSELAEGFVQSPEDVVSIGDEVDVRVLKVDRRKRQIDLSMKTSSVEALEEVMPDEENIPTAMELALRRAQKRADGRKPTRKKRKDYSAQDDVINRTLRNLEE